MKTKRIFFYFALLALISLCAACTSSPGPAERAGRAVDNAVYNTGAAVERTGQKIENAVD